MRNYVFFAGVVTTLVAGCISTQPPQYFTLNMTPSGRVQSDINFNIESVEVAEALQRESILIMASPTTIEYYAAEQWVAGLHELIRRKLENEFGERSDTAPTFGMALSVFSFEQLDTDSGLQARASIGVEIRQLRQSRYTDALFEKTYTIVKPAQGDAVNAVVEALSLCLEDIACEIVKDTKELSAPTD